MKVLKNNRNYNGHQQGFRTLHKSPRADRRYFTFKSLLIRLCKKVFILKKVVKYAFKAAPYLIAQLAAGDLHYRSR